MKQMMMLLMLVIVVVAAYFAVVGFMMHQEVATQEANFHALQDEYFSLDKATRDAAITDGELNQDLVEIKNYPSELLRLKLVGVGRILTGIFVLLFGILLALMMMPMKLGMIIKSKK